MRTRGEDTGAHEGPTRSHEVRRQRARAVKAGPGYHGPRHMRTSSGGAMRRTEACAEGRDVKVRRRACGYEPSAGQVIAVRHAGHGHAGRRALHDGLLPHRLVLLLLLVLRRNSSHLRRRGRWVHQRGVVGGRHVLRSSHVVRRRKVLRGRLLLLLRLLRLLLRLLRLRSCCTGHAGHATRVHEHRVRLRAHASTCRQQVGREQAGVSNVWHTQMIII